MKIVTWNLRCEWRGDGANALIHRAGLIYEKVMAERPAVIAFQEVIPPALALLRRLLPEYEFFGGMRTAQHDGEGLYTAVLREEVTLLGGDVFWLSPTPHIPGSRFAEQGILPRIGVYTRLLARQPRECFHLFNLHLDHQSPEVARFGLACTLDYIAGRGDAIDRDRTILLGDFNVTPDSPALAPLAEADWLLDATADLPGTYHAFGTRKNERGEREDCKIDYIYLSATLCPRLAAVTPWQDEHAGIYLSDHYPIAAEIQ